MNFSMKKIKGFSLIELMVAMLIGLIILLGLVSLFSNVSILNRAQTGFATMQENGRYAISRLKSDIENVGQKHCASVALPNNFITEWDQGYEMKPWYINNAVNLAASASTNGLPTLGQTRLDSTVTGETDQLGDSPVPANLNAYPMDSSFFMKGHECTGTACLPLLNVVGSDLATNFPAAGLADGSRLPDTDILTLRYLTGGTRVQTINGNVATTVNPIPADSDGNALIADCNVSLVVPANWGANAVTSTAPDPLPAFSVASNTSVYSMNRDFQTVSYYVMVETDPNNNNRLISSLYRSQNGVSQQVIQGVERFDVFYLAQLQTGRVARLTAAQVQNVSGGGDVDNNGAIDGDNGCTLPATINDYPNFDMPNDPGCLWRSIYAVEVNMLLNTVNDSTLADDERYIYSIDSELPQDPSAGLIHNLPAYRMYRKQFSAIVPVRNYTL